MTSPVRDVRDHCSKCGTRALGSVPVWWGVHLRETAECPKCGFVWVVKREGLARVVGLRKEGDR